MYINKKREGEGERERTWSWPNSSYHLGIYLMTKLSNTSEHSIRHATGSNLGQKTQYPGWRFSKFPLFLGCILAEKCFYFGHNRHIRDPVQHTVSCKCYYLLGYSAVWSVREPTFRRNVPPPSSNKLHGLSPRANYTDRATAASRRSGCQLLRIKGATWSAW
jgi:hypothetical protein